MRKLYWYVSSYTRKHGLVVLLTFLVGLVLFSFLVPTLLTTFDPKPRQYIGLIGQYQINSLPKEIQELISTGITQVQEDGTVTPELAERWTVEDEGKTYRFLIKKNLQWQDGKQLETKDIQYQFNDVEMIATPNDVVFKLPSAFVPFPTVVSQPIFRPGTITKYAFFRRPGLIGLGEYRLVDYRRQGNRLTEVILDNQRQRRIYRFYLTEQDAVTAFKRGEVDILPDMSTTYDLHEWSSVQSSQELKYHRYVAVFFNVEDPIFSKNIRQALAYATRKPSDDSRAIGPIPSTSWAYLEGGKTYEFDLDRAQERLLSEYPPQAMVIELTTLPQFEATANTIKQDWEALGVKAVGTCQADKAVTDKKECAKLQIQVNIRISPFADTSSFQALLIGQESPTDPDQYFLWHSDQPSNFTRFRNTRIDSILEKGRQTVDQTERLALYSEFQQFLLEDVPAIFIQYLPTYRIERK